MKQGYKTTEFWAMLATSIVTAVNSSGALDFVLPVEAIATLAGLVATYILSRGIAKLNAKK